MRVETYGGLDVYVAGGPDREGGGNGPVVILLHGFGAPGDDLVSLWRMGNGSRTKCGSCSPSDP